MKRILIVEDEFLTAKRLSVILEEVGYLCKIGIATVAEAIECINNSHFDLVLIDVNLRGNVDGSYLGSYLLEKDIIPFIYITGNTDYITIEKIKETRPYGVISKPFKIVDVTTAVAVVLNNFQFKKIDVLRGDIDEVDFCEAPFKIKSILSFISSNISEKIEVRVLARKANWSEQYLIKMFMKYLGCTPYQYVLKQKIQRAIQLIKYSDTSLTNISYDLGFSSYSNFCSAFRKITNKSPNVYRNQSTFLKRENLY